MSASPPKGRGDRAKKPDFDEQTATAAGLGAGVSGSLLGAIVGANMAGRKCPHCGASMTLADIRCSHCGK